MTFPEETFLQDIKNDLICALSFVLDNDTDLELGEPVKVRQILSTTQYTVDGEFIAGDVYGKVQIPYAVKQGQTTATKILICFENDELSECTYTTQSKDFLDAITNEYKLYLNRVRAKPFRNKKIIELCNQIKTAKNVEDASKIADQILSTLESNYAD